MGGWTLRTEAIVEEKTQNGIQAFNLFRIGTHPDHNA